MHIAYCDESADRFRTVASAVVIPENTWRPAYRAIRDFRDAIKAKYGIPLGWELHSHDLVAGKGKPGGRKHPIGRSLGAQIYLEAVDTLNALGPLGVYGVNVSILNSQHKKPMRQAILWMLQRLENNLTKTGNYGLVVYDGQEKQRRTLVRRTLRRMNVYNPVPSILYRNTYRNLPVQSILGDPFMRDSEDDAFIQMADVMAFALLRQDIPPKHPITLAKGVDKAFNRLPDIWLTAASRSDPQGVVR